ncbi:MAG TPA: arginine--tRNA ligase, partial [Calditrichia bacterium]|nr:arginine--tRNA ligase [Calditrichia bacterium]
MLKIEYYLREITDQALRDLGYPETDYQIERPKQAAHGDFSINAAMLLARPLKQNPRQIGQALLAALKPDSERISKIEIAGPGFINLFLSNRELERVVRDIHGEGKDFGRIPATGKTALVEFVSANPTGPLTVGHGRQAVIGDTVANLLSWIGYEVTREYYFNNAGRQMRVLGNSVLIRYRQLLGEDIEFPEDHYQGDYIRDIAQNLMAEKGRDLAGGDLKVFTHAAEKAIFADIDKTLQSINIVFDTYFNESDLYTQGKIEEVIQALRDKDLAYDHDGAVWFRATNFGLDQDRVIVKSSGEPTYRLPDIAYHRNKFARGYDEIVDIFGADHIATYPDVLAGLQALGYETEKIRVLILQFVTLMEGQEKIKMSTRKANYVTLDELIEEAGGDVTRWFFLMRSIQSHLNFDLKLAKNQSDENPVYYNQYAHARICSIIRTAEERGLTFAGDIDLGYIEEPSEKELVKKLMEFPRV